MLHELRGAAYEDFEEELCTQAVETKLAMTEALISEDIWCGRTGPTNQQTRDLYLEGTYSELNLTGISDIIRNKREIQSTGPKISPVEDDIFRYAREL